MTHEGDLLAPRIPVAMLLAPVFGATPRAMPPPVGVVRSGGQLVVLTKATFALEAAGADEPRALVSLAPDQEGFTIEEFSPQESVDPEAFAPGAVVGVGSERASQVRLPTAHPCGTLLELDETRHAVDLAADRLTVDRDRGTAALTFRGTLPCSTPLRLVVHWQDGEARSWEAVRREVPRALFSFAIEEADLRGAPPSPFADDELAAARYATWSEVPPPPALTLERYAAAAADVAEGQGPRAEALARHGMDEYLWTLEEWAWMDLIASRTMEGDVALAEAYASRFEAEQDALARPSERGTTLEDYADILVAIERSEDPMRVLKGWAMTLPEWMRLDRRFSRHASSDPKVARELERLCELGRASVGEERDGDG